MVQSFLQAEVGQVVRTDLTAQERGELLVLLDEGVLGVSAEDVMPVLDLFERRVELAFQFPGQAHAEDLRDLMGSQTPQPDLTTPLEDLVNRKRAFENEVPAVLDLTDGVEAAQVHRGALPLGKLRSED